VQTVPRVFLLSPQRVQSDGGGQRESSRKERAATLVDARKIRGRSPRAQGETSELDTSHRKKAARWSRSSALMETGVALGVRGDGLGEKEASGKEVEEEAGQTRGVSRAPFRGARSFPRGLKKLIASRRREERHWRRRGGGGRAGSKDEPKLFRGPHSLFNGFGERRTFAARKKAPHLGGLEVQAKGIKRGGISQHLPFKYSRGRSISKEM